MKNIVFDKDIIYCKNVFCNVHHAGISNLYCDILKACISADKCIPRSGNNSNGKVIPGWNEHAGQYHDEAMWWHRKWINEGRPADGETAEMRRITRALYHRQVSQIKKDKDRIVKERMAKALSESNDRDIWKEIRKMKNNKNSQPISVDNISDVDSINNLFTNTYKNLYNSVPYNETEMDAIVKNVNNRINSDEKYFLTVEHVIKGIKHLKTGKCDGEEGLMSDHVINAPHTLSIMLTIVFNAMITHGMSPESMLVGTMIPIPKGKRQVVCCSENFRAITLSSVFGKVLDWVILIKESSSLQSSELQFGFKSGVSTTHCTMALQETVSYYNAKKSNAYVLMLDASKAFDRVEYSKLFKLLLRKGVSVLIVRLLICMYTKQRLRVRWSHVISDTFGAQNGVKQGGVLSPILFAIYMDELLIRLKKSGIGCHIGNTFLAALAYADDVTLVCPTLKSLKLLVKICEVYADEYHVLFNGPKSKLLVFKGRDCVLPLDVCIYVNGQRVGIELCADHLGHKVSSTDDESMLKGALSSFWRYFNNFMSEFGHLYGAIKCKLFKQYCCSYYGSPLWDLSSKGVDSLCIAWRKALRSLWKVHPMTHNDIIAVMSDTLPLKLQLLKRFCKFYEKCTVHDNPVIPLLVKVASNNPFSPIGKNIRMLCKFKEMYTEWLLNKDIVFDNVRVIKELIEVRESQKQVSYFDLNEIDFIIENLCVS